MPWTKRDYPQSMKNLKPRTREKAVDIANTLVEEEDYPEGRAIAIAQAQAKRWAKGERPPRPKRRLKPGQKRSGRHEGPKRHVQPHERGWQVRREGSRRASRVFGTKEAAVDAAVGMARGDKGKVVLHTADGGVDETWDV